ncbi:CDP-diacylglycerol--glycerol-3-phosphate 3-phosphatidyltransferase [Geodermatophilus dictyosporus]|uniref:Phosphatidylinositol phosphate synthase n=1 Tax=Geodermatophilus dictyosporus TaxID=1523247 RepID=A0A1I5PWR6_9ACTN|nr:CDP-alcohol phosphatidyltransferase family protein [Geodermatophilus dictyosporus]SFP38472.1 CDP-diacylglycerol--glycerol-3-phosphate 3-phosphatidyltransferase [Geodermatophilus dictyosporus]
MLGQGARAAVGRFWAPVVTRLARAGVTPDMVTVTGTLGAIAGAVLLIAHGQLFWGAFTVTVFVLLDMLDGALARARGGGSAFGAVLDSTCDRAVDAAVFGALVWWFTGAGANRLLALLALVALVLGVLTSYTKARAEGVGIPCDVGLVERTERLILVLTGTGLTGLGLPYLVDVGLWLSVAGGAVTVAQRIAAVHRGSRGKAAPAASAPAR